MENSIRDNANDDELTKIMNIVDTVKNDSEERRRYMGIMNVIDYEKREAYIHGLIQAYKSLNISKEITKMEIMREFSFNETAAEDFISRYWDVPHNNTQP